MEEVNKLRNLLFISLVMTILIIIIIIHRKHYGDKFKINMYYWLWLIIGVRLLFPMDISNKNLAYRIESPGENLETENTFERIGEEIRFNKDKIANRSQLRESKYIDIKPRKEKTSFSNYLKKNYKKIYFYGFFLYFTINIFIYIRQKSIIKNKVVSRDRELSNIFKNLKEEIIPDKKLELRISDFSGSPMVIGFLNPTLYIPKYINYDEVEYILNHEFIHIKRNDTIYKFILFLAKTIHWFNPIVHIMAKKAYEDIELSCDERVVEKLSQEEKIAYGKTLIGSIESSFNNTAFTTNFKGGKSMIKKRIDTIFNSIKKKNGKPIISLLLIVIVSTGLLISCDSQVNDKDNSLGAGIRDIVNGTNKIVKKILEDPELSDKLNFSNYGNRRDYKNTINLNEESKILEDIENLKLQLISADLELTYGSENKIEYIGNKDNEDLRLEFEVDNGILRINEYSIDGLEEDIELKCILTLDKDTYNNILIESVSGDIRTDKLQARDQVEIDAISGEIKVDNIQGGTLDISTNSGKLSSNNIKIESYIYIDNISANLNIKNVLAKNLDISTNSGMIILNNIKVEEKLAIDNISGLLDMTTIFANVLDIYTSSGDLISKDMDIGNDFAISAVSGELAIDNINAKKLGIETSSGSLALTNGEVEVIKIDTVSGIQKIDKIKGRELTVDSSSGEVMINSSLDKIDIDTVSGGVKIEGKNPYVNIDTSSGNINIETLEKNFNVDIENSNGSSKVYGRSYSKDLVINNKSKNQINIVTVSGNIIVE